MVADNRARITWDWLPEDSAAVSPSAGNTTPSAFEFVQSLAAELSRGRVDLPTSPDVAQHLREALDEADLSNTLVTRLVGADPGLAANVLELANGKASARGSRPFTDLKLAVTRVGPDNVRSAALPYVMEKIRSAQAHEHLGHELARLWERSTLVASIARVLAERTHAAPPDVALLAGLLHNVGAVYLVTRAEKHLSLFQNPVTRDALMHDWQAPIGKAIAQNWGLPDMIADAIGDQDQLDRHDAGARDLTDILCVAVRAASFIDHPEELEIMLGSLPLFRRLRLDRSLLRDIMREAMRHTRALRMALSLDQ